MIDIILRISAILQIGCRTTQLFSILDNRHYNKILIKFETKKIYIKNKIQNSFMFIKLFLNMIEFEFDQCPIQIKYYSSELEMNSTQIRYFKFKSEIN